MSGKGPFENSPNAAGRLEISVPNGSSSVRVTHESPSEQSGGNCRSRLEAQDSASLHVATVVRIHLPALRIVYSNHIIPFGGRRRGSNPWSRTKDASLPGLV